MEGKVGYYHTRTRRVDIRLYFGLDSLSISNKKYNIIDRTDSVVIINCIVKFSRLKMEIILYVECLPCGDGERIQFITPCIAYGYRKG